MYQRILKYRLFQYGMWRESEEKYGTIYEDRTGSIELLRFLNPVDNYEKVSAVDGVMLITQQDLKWREDIFNGWHFYDISHCMEFNRKKLEIVVPKQDEPWCFHDCGVTDITVEYEFYRQRFLDEYAVDIFRWKR